MDDLESLPIRIQDAYNSCNKEERECLLQILQELSEFGESSTYENIWMADYKEIPVSINTFITSDTYLGKVTRNGDAIYPSWKGVMNDIFVAGNVYQEVILTGATRIGKTSTAITCVAYLLYWLMCLRDPQKFFDKKAESKFAIAFFNLNLKLAEGVAFREFNDTLKASPWFNAHGTFSKSERNFYYIPEGDKIEIMAGSDASHFLGRQIFAAILDEINFSRAGVKDVNKAKEHVKNTYVTVADRIRGTFRKGGEVYGKIFAVSSKRSDSDFMEQYVEDQLSAGARDHMYVFSRPQWEVLPKSQYTNNGLSTFTIAVGDRYHRGFVVEPENDTFEGNQELISQGFTLMYPPIDYFTEFKADFDIALRDIAGITTPGAMSFISQEAISACINLGRRNPFINEVLQIGTKDSLTIEEFFHMEFVPPELKRCPLFLHLDLSLNTDKSGIGANCISGRQDIIGEDGKTISVPSFSHVFSLSIEAPRGDKIPYQKIVNFVCWLRRSGFNIAGISRDQFQSEYLAQLLEAQGFNVTKLSLDRTPDGYIALRSVLLEQRVDMIDVKLLQDELIHLQRDAVTGRVDHPVGGCFTGDTKIRLVDGRSLTILDLLDEQDQHKTNWVYTVNECTKKIEPKKIKKVFQTKITKDLVRVTFDNGESVVCTPDHRFMLRDGSFEVASLLGCGDSLMPLYTKVVDTGLAGYRLYYEPSEDRWHYEHRQFCIGNTFEKGTVVHHCNYRKEDNRPTNLRQMRTSDHRRLHNNCTLDYSKVAESERSWWESARGTAAEALRRESSRQATISALRNAGEYKNLEKAREERISAIESRYGVIWGELSASDKNKYGQMHSRELDPTICTRISSTLSIRHEEGKFTKAREALSGRVWYTNGVENVYIKATEDPPDGYYRGRTLSETTLSKMQEAKTRRTDEQRAVISKLLSENNSQRIWVTDGSDDKYIRKDAVIPEGYHRGRSKTGKNHKVASVERIAQPCRVYDLEIEDNHNFALDCGVFVHNSKDMSDAFAGSIWNAILTNPAVPVQAKKVASVIASVNGRRSSPSSDLPAMFPDLYRNRR